MSEPEPKVSGFLFILGDGDRIRERIEGLLLRSDLEKLSDFSSKLSAAIASLAHQLETKMDADVIMSAGDDLLACVEVCKYKREELERSAREFLAQVGASISFGVGPSIESAYINLRRAKASSGDRIVETGASR